MSGNNGEVKENINFSLNITPCTSLTVDISSNRRRRCFRNITTVKYANEGYVAADNVQLKVVYPQYVVPIRSSTAWTSRQDTVITYNLGRLEAGQTGQIMITDSVVCGNESIRGLTQCTKAIITKGSCQVSSSSWDKADLKAFSQCINASSVRLAVINIGEPMRDSTNWRLFFNGVLKQQGKLKLGKGENYTMEVFAKGNTIRLEADQTPNHPVGKYALTTIERCGGIVAFNAVLPPPSVQLPVNITPISEETATSCMPIIDSYDPNDKQVIPAGVGANKIVRETDELEFQIRFQNTGTDTAYTVVIRDTLSTALDIASLQVGAASHNYTYTVSGKNNPIITWTFNNINLPAQKQDDAGSNGFVKFKIAQVPNNPKGTKITNKAGIYFDYNSPIITNETNLTVGDLLADLNNAADLASIFVCNTQTQPTPPQAGADQLTANTSVVLTANAPSKGIASWRVVQGTGEFVNPNSPTTTVNKVGLGENIYEWSISLCNVVATSKVKITRVATPKADITTKGDTLIAEEADSYQWFLNGQPIVGATNRTWVATQNGNYTVVIKKFGNTYTSPVFRHLITGIEDDLLQKATNLVPNPAQNSCTLTLTNEYWGEITITISNAMGQVVFQTTTIKREMTLQQTIDLQHFISGIYFVNLRTARGKVVKKLVKM
jgi:fimbrial isopeptide formation D2 family protein